MNWDYADKYGLFNGTDRMKVEAMVKIAEQLEQLNKQLTEINQNLKPLTIKGGVNTHAY